MEYYFFLIIVIIVLKILFWTCYFYVRSQRLRQANAPRRFIIVNARPRQLENDRSAIINHAEPVSATGPPPYAQVVKDGNTALPPSYEQAVPGAAVGPGAGVNSTMAAPPYSVQNNYGHSYPGGHSSQPGQYAAPASGFNPGSYTPAPTPAPSAPGQ